MAHSRPLSLSVLCGMCLCGLLPVALSGCAETWHNLQPHRMWRLNQTPGRQGDAYFSVSDTQAAAAAGKTSTDERPAEGNLSDD